MLNPILFTRILLIYFVSLQDDVPKLNVTESKATRKQTKSDEATVELKL
jgi:hypothetical protein